MFQCALDMEVHSQSGRRRQTKSLTDFTSSCLAATLQGYASPTGLAMARRIPAIIAAVRLAPCLPHPHDYGGSNE